VPTRFELYRQRAMECEALAERANDAKRKARLREAAKQWVDLADQLNSWIPRKMLQNLPVIVAGSVICGRPESLSTDYLAEHLELR
jgi:hypothetical protein